MRDQFNREINYLRISLTELCNLRCVYCMPECGVVKKSHAEMMSFEEIVAAARAAARLGVSKIRLTGGEPLVKKDVVKLVGKIAQIEGISKICVTTNGVLLSKMAADLKAAGVEYLNISLDTLDEAKFRRITRVGELKDVLRGVEAALGVGFKSVKINSVLIGGFNDDEVSRLAALTLRQPTDVRFIELMPMLGVFGKEAFMPYTLVLQRLKEAVLRGEFGEELQNKLLCNLASFYPSQEANLLPKETNIVPKTTNKTSQKLCNTEFKQFLDKTALTAKTPRQKSAFVAQILEQMQGILTPAQAAFGSTARLVRLTDALANIGLISPVSEHFCASCNRIRLTSDGKIKPCLHSSEEISLKGLSEEGMFEVLQRAIFSKPKEHDELGANKLSKAGRNMHQIGG